MKLLPSLPLVAVLLQGVAPGQEIVAQNEAEITLGYVVRPLRGTITVDGRLDEAGWREAVKVAGFRVSGKEELAHEQTVMQLLYDRDNLYLGVKCAEPMIGRLVTEVLVDDGDLWRDDCVEFFLDANHDHSTYWQFIVNSAAAKYDAFRFDRTWNADWRAAAVKTDDAWFVEVALPFKSLGVSPPRAGDVWGFNLDRERRAGGGTQLYNWADVKGDFHSPTRFGHLCFVGPDLGNTGLDPQRFATAIQGREAHLYVDGGYWIVQAGQSPRQWTYRELLRAREDAIQEYWTKLEAIYAKRPETIRRKEFEGYRTRIAEMGKLARSTGPVDPEACAAGKVFLDSLGDKLRNLYWSLRIALLNETF